MDYLTSYLSSRASINSRTWGPLEVEAASFTPASDGDLVVRIGNLSLVQRPLVRIHSECVFAEVFDSDLCDCKDQLELALQRMTAEGAGILFYLRFDGRGAGLAAKVRATALEVAGEDTYNSRIQIGVPPEGRSFRTIGKYLMDNRILDIRLLTNSPDKCRDLECEGILIERCALYLDNPSEKVRTLYRTKKDKFGHDIPLK